jgi:malate synthase
MMAKRTARKTGKKSSGKKRSKSRKGSAKSAAKRGASRLSGATKGRAKKAAKRVSAAKSATRRAAAVARGKSGNGSKGSTWVNAGARGGGGNLGRARKTVKRAARSAAGAAASGDPSKRARRAVRPFGRAAAPASGGPAEKRPAARAALSPGDQSPALKSGSPLRARRVRSERSRATGGRVRARVRPPAGSAAGVDVIGTLGPRYEEILTPAALAFLGELHRRFEGKRDDILARRRERQARFDAGELPDFPAETRDIRESDWTVAPIPADLRDRRVEITGPVDRKMIINALNSGATHYMADFEDANSPTWSNNLEGQINLKDLWDDRIAFTDSGTGKAYAVKDEPAVLIVRPRGWHLVEEHLTVDGQPIAGALFDFGLYVFHNAMTLIGRGTAPYFYLPKLEAYEEARLWNEVLLFAQESLGIPAGTIKATVLIETLPAAFEMDEIIYELRQHIVGLNAGRWDYIFSFIKKLAKNPHYVLPDRGEVVMGKAFLGAYAALLVKTCHRRGAFAMGGMAAQIPVKNDPAANEIAFAKVRADKEREVREGHDGTWVAHPDLVPVAKQVFDRLMPRPNQLDNQRADIEVSRADLLRVHEGTKTEQGFRLNIRVGVQYIEAWLRGRGAVPIYNLMEDAATAEISRAQIWQWLKYGAELENGITVTPRFFEQALTEEMERVKAEIGTQAYAEGRFPEAIDLFRKLSLASEFVDFLTIPAYKLIV